MKRDIQICYNTIETICSSLNSFKIAIEDVKASVKKIDSYIQENSGKAVNELIENGSIIEGELNACQEEVEDLYKIFSEYIDATTYYIKPINPTIMMRVDRNDIWWNLFSVPGVKASCESLAYLKHQYYATTSAAFYLKEEEKERENRKLRHNYDEMEEYRNKFCRIYENIEDELDELENIYKTKIIEFENEDDLYAKKASELCDKYSSGREKINDFVFVAVISYVKMWAGEIKAIQDFVQGIVELMIAIEKYRGVWVVCLLSIPTGKIPKWAIDYLEKVDSTKKAILKDPLLIVEGMVQEGSDAYEEKGIAYSTGYVGTSIAIDLILSGKLKYFNKFDDAIKGLGKKKPNILSAAADEIVEAGASTEAIKGSSAIVDDVSSSIKNIDDFINGNKTFDEVLGDYANVYAENIKANKPWSWDNSIPGSENLTKKQRSVIKQQAIDNGLIPRIEVKKVDGMKYGFADFESTGVVKETFNLPDEMWKLSDTEQFKWLDEQIGGTVEGYTWHHTETPGKMELVPTGVHNIVTHNGGRTTGMWADAPR